MTTEQSKLADKIENWSPGKHPLTLIACERRLAVAALRASSPDTRVREALEAIANEKLNGDHISVRMRVLAKEALTALPQPGAVEPVRDACVETGVLPASAQKSASVQQASHSSGERLPSSDAAGAEADTALDPATVEACAKAVSELRQAEAGDLNERYMGQRGQDRSDALVAAYQAIRALIGQPARNAEVVRPGYVQIPQSALDWLNGEAPAPEGKWFGEYEDEILPSKTWIKRTYWWRSKFRELCGAVSSTDNCSHPHAVVWFYRDGDTFMRCPDCMAKWCTDAAPHTDGAKS